MFRVRRVPAREATGILRRFGAQRQRRRRRGVRSARLDIPAAGLHDPELGLLLLTQSVLNDAVRDGARLIRVGQADTSSIFVAKVCAKAGPLVPSLHDQPQIQGAGGKSFGALSATTALANQYDAGIPRTMSSSRSDTAAITLLPWTAIISAAPISGRPPSRSRTTPTDASPPVRSDRERRRLRRDRVRPGPAADDFALHRAFSRSRASSAPTCV